MDTKNFSKIQKFCPTPLCGNPAFTRGGVTVFAGKSGSGKSVYLEKLVKDLERLNLGVYYFNTDESPMEIDTYSPVLLGDLVAEIARSGNKQDVVIVDTLKAFCAYSGINIDSDTDAYRMMQKLAEVSHKTGVSVILVHHCDDDEVLEGSDSIYEGADQITIFKRDKNTGEACGIVKKQRFGADPIGVIQF